MSNSSIQQTCSMKTMWKYILQNINLFENEITFPLNIPIHSAWTKSSQWICYCVFLYGISTILFLIILILFCFQNVHIHSNSYISLLCHGYGCCFVWCFTVFPAISLWAHWHQRRIRFKSYLRMHSNKISYAISFLKQMNLLRFPLVSTITFLYSSLYDFIDLTERTNKIVKKQIRRFQITRFSKCVSCSLSIAQRHRF